MNLWPNMSILPLQFFSTPKKTKWMDFPNSGLWHATRIWSFGPSTKTPRFSFRFSFDFFSILRGESRFLVSETTMSLKRGIFFNTNHRWHSTKDVAMNKQTSTKVDSWSKWLVLWSRRGDFWRCDFMSLRKRGPQKGVPENGWFILWKILWTNGMIWGGKNFPPLFLEKYPNIII